MLKRVTDGLFATFMLTVPEAAARAGCDPETIRRWIRAGKLRARKVGTQHVIEEQDLRHLLDAKTRTLPLPPDWRKSRTGEPMPDIPSAIRGSRAGR